MRRKSTIAATKVRYAVRAETRDGSYYDFGTERSLSAARRLRGRKRRSYSHGLIRLAPHEVRIFRETTTYKEVA